MRSYLHLSIMSILYVFSLFLLLNVPKLCAGFDYFMFAQQWPRSFCNKQIQDGGRKCRGSIPKHFTIHGLWPENLAGELHDCNNRSALNHTEINPLNAALSVGWPNLVGKNFDFWAFEWLKHGTCSENSFSQRQYFMLAMTLVGKTGLVKLLSDEKIVPDKNKTYAATSVIDAIRKGTSHDPQLNCYFDTQQNVTMLAEIRVCLEKDGKSYRDCSYPSGNCNSNGLRWPIV